MSLLQKGPKYNLHTKQQNWLQNLALEAETAISQLSTSNRNMYRKLVAEHINTLHQNNHHQPTHNTHPEARTIKTIKFKPKNNNAMITRADKGNFLVILPIQQYESKVHNILQANQFQTISTDPTKTYQAQTCKTIHSSKTLIPHDTKCKYINMNPSAPTIKGLIKLHKPDQPIRPVVNWHSTPAYKLAKLFTQKASHLTLPPNALNI
jgi:hypothetical protein